MNKKIIIISSIALVLVLTSGLFAYNMHGERGHMRKSYYGKNTGYNGGCYGRNYNDRNSCGNFEGGRYSGYYNGDLKDEDISKIQALEEKYGTQINTLKTEIYNQIQAIRLEMTKDNPNQNFINSAIDAKTKAEASLQKLMMEYRLEMRKIVKKWTLD